ncbi:hypothetical protein [Pseudomonas guariconensis]|uniref:hypothetical protein n=1 Tax=Pseudomonas guariconensis TaxID=1288410 RepID=UPI0018A9D537|nr:hypothetical protein [Pseudomonas guariconensis]MBF8743586.1 hypothetical protein [Pseudomonas guariconensis]MBF8752974.1 hypothetical protein [Pseudomonas guariconensis]
MSGYVFEPDLCFNARCWWQLLGVRVDPCAWDRAVGHLAPLWVRFESGDGEDGWMRVEPEGALLPSSSLRTSSAGILCDVLWFGVYRIHEQFAYEIRPAYVGQAADLWPKLDYVMSKDFGYVGMSGSRHPAGSGHAPLWIIDSLDPRRVELGQRPCNLELIDPSGASVRRYRQFGRPYLATHQGVRGLLSLEIVNMPVPVHPRPLG